MCIEPVDVGCTCICGAGGVCPRPLRWAGGGVSDAPL